jgi:hypothetical protein
VLNPGTVKRPLPITPGPTAEDLAKVRELRRTGLPADAA